MVDRTARDRYAELLRQFISGRFTNFDYEDQWGTLSDTDDRAVSAIYCNMWYGYCDIRKHKMTEGGRVTDETHRMIARWVTFLYSDLEYEWPSPGLLEGCVNLFTFGLWKRFFPSAPCTGDVDVWPFFRKSDLDSELARPRLLAGSRDHPAALSYG